MEPASRLQNQARKTNTGPKLDFPKHSIPSHFTHHCGLETRIEEPWNPLQIPNGGAQWKIWQTNVLRTGPRRSKSLNMKLKTVPTNVKILQFYSPPPPFFFYLHPQLLFFAWAAVALALNPNEGKDGGEGLFLTAVAPFEVWTPSWEPETLITQWSWKG